MSIYDKQMKTIKYCSESFNRKNSYSCASYFADLILAEQNDIISDGWHTQLPTTDIQVLIDKKMDVVKRYWWEDFQQTSKILLYGGRLEYEEMMLVLSNMSGLQSIGAVFLMNQQDQIKTLYEYLTDLINNNIQMVNTCRNKPTLGLESLLPSHWWWRVNTPNG